jgi:hypothetical protein
MRRARHVARVGIRWWTKLMDRDHLEDLGVDGKLKLNWIIKK